MSLRELVHLNRPFNVPVQQRGRFGQSLHSLQEEMNDLFEDFFSSNGLKSWMAPMGSAFPSVDIIENEKKFKVKAEIAGYNPDDIDVSVTDGFLTISGKRKEEEEEKEENYLRRELSYGSFQRTIALPETSNCEEAEASFKNGMLTIDIPKKAEAMQKPKKVTIKK